MRFDIALLGSLGIPFNCFFAIPRNALAVGVASTQIALRDGVALLGGFAFFALIRMLGGGIDFYRKRATGRGNMV